MESAPKKRQFSTASIRIFADNIDKQFDSNKFDNTPVDTFLNTLANIDRQIHQDFNQVRAELKISQSETRQAQQALEGKTQQFDNLKLEASAHKNQVHSLTAHVAKLQARIRELEYISPCTTISPTTSTQPSSSDTQRDVHALSTMLHPSRCNCRPSTDGSPKFYSNDHAKSCALRQAIVAETPAHEMADVIMAREDAYRNQKILIDRLKADNKQLQATYNDLWTRYQYLYDKYREGNFDTSSNKQPADQLLTSTQQGGRVANEASRLEHQLKMHTTENEDPNAKNIPDETMAEVSTIQIQASENFTDEYDNDATVSEFDFCYRTSVKEALARTENQQPEERAVTEELLRTMALQQQAHEKLRQTVLELTTELGRIDPQSMQTDLTKYKTQIRTCEHKLEQVTSKLKSKNNEILDLRRQLTKVIAEYEAISVAHSYSNAELSKIRATNREKTKLERQLSDARVYARAPTVLDGNDTRNHRKLHFR